MAELLPAAIRARCERLLEELCAISSASGDAAGLRSLAERMRPELEAHGLAVELRNEPSEGQNLPLLLARAPRAGDRFLPLVGHLDTVLPAPPATRGE